MAEHIASAVVTNRDSDDLVPGVAGNDSQVGRQKTRRPLVWVVLGSAVLIGVVVPLALAVATGGLSIPHNDAWSYSRIAQTFGLTGRIELLGWNRSALFGQFMVLGPLARWLTVQQIFVAVLGVVALVAVYDLLVSSIGRKRAAFAVAVVAAWPGFGLLATSFMPDVPAMAAMMVCLALGRRALQNKSDLLLVVSTLFGIWGVTIREQALAAPAAVLLLALAAAWRSKRTRAWVVVMGTGVLFVVSVAAFELWRRSYNAEDPPVVSVPESMLHLGTSTVVRTYFILALGLAPAVLLVARPWRWRRGTLLASGAALLVAVAAVYDFRPHGFFVGNYLDPNGPYWVAGDGHPAPIISPHLWWLVVAAACGSGVLLAGILVRQLPRMNPLLGVFLLLMFLGNLASALSGQTLFDRYWLLAAPPLLAAVLAERSPVDSPAVAWLSGRIPAAVAWVGLAGLSLTVTAAGMAYDSARWKAAEQVVASGVRATDVRAGLEWDGYHSAIGMSPAGSAVFPGSRPCFVVTADRRPNQAEVRVVTFKTFVIAGTSRLWVYDNKLPGC